MHWLQWVFIIIAVLCIAGIVSMPTHAWDHNGPVRAVMLLVLAVVLLGLYSCAHWLLS